MRSSRDHILTSHAGSLPRPDALIEAYRARETGEAADDRALEEQLQRAVSEVVRRQRELGIDVPGDGEYGKSMGHRVNYGAWWRYSFLRLGGLEMSGPGLYEMPARRSRPGEVVLTSFADRRDRTRFAAAYADPDSGITTGPRPANHPVCVAPLSYTGREAIAADITRFKSGEEILQIGRFSDPPALEDLATLTVGPDDFDVRSCRVGDCGIRLPAAAIDLKVPSVHHVDDH